MSTRVITVVATKNGRITKFSENPETQSITITSAGNADRTVNNSDPITTWGGLRSLLSNEGYDLENLKPTENINKTTLEHIDAVLPTGDFRLFLRPSKTKSGGFDVTGKGFKELRALVTTDEIKIYLSGLETGKNWTQLSTESLRKGLTSVSTAYSANTVTEIPTVTETVAETLVEVASVKTNKQKAEEAKALLQSIYDTTTCDEVEERVDSILDEVDGLIIELDDCDEDETEDNSVETENKRLERIEKEEIARELRELEEGF